MNTEQEQHLEKIFRDNQNQGIAIAITGCWGVGKTFAWNRFLQEKAKLEEEKIKHEPAYKRKIESRIFSKKYAYISLFGIESLSDLKAAISTNMSSNYFNKESSQNFEIPTFVKKGLSALRDVKISGNGEGFGINSSAKIFEAVLYSQVKDAIICFDDFERMSRKLDIQDVMGLANQLKLERNCQVVLILDESRTEGENQKKYADYKEKLIDETIKITSVEPLIREKGKDIDKPLVDLMVKFAEELEIHNFRFFQKVINLYRQFIEQLPNEVADSTKEIILVRILQGYLIEDFGIKYGISWSDLTLQKAFRRNLDKQKKDIEPADNEIFKQLGQVSAKFVYSSEDRWLIEFQQWFGKREAVDFEELKKLAQSELISENNNLLKDQLQALMNKWRNLEVDDTYCESLFTVASKLVAIESLGILALSADLLKKFGRPELSKSLKKLIIDSLKTRLENDALEIYEKHLRFPVQHLTIFHRYIKMFRLNNPTTGLPSLVNVLKADLIEGVQLHFAKEVINNTKESEWEVFIFEDASTDPELSKLTKADVIDRLLSNLNIIGVDQAILETKIRNVLESRMDRLEPSAIKENYKLVIENFKKEGLL